MDKYFEAHPKGQSVLWNRLAQNRFISADTESDNCQII